MQYMTVNGCRVTKYYYYYYSDFCLAVKFSGITVVELSGTTGASSFTDRMAFLWAKQQHQSTEWHVESLHANNIMYEQILYVNQIRQK